MTGVPVTGRRRFAGPGTRRETLRVGIPRGPSGLYFARLQSPGGWLGFAPFVLRPRRLGLHRVAVILPTNTWQAYNFLDANGDGVGDTWYADPHYNGVDLARPFVNRGAPSHYWGFIRWLAHTGKPADVLSDDDLESVASGDVLARLYDLIVFAGHEEYVTTRVYDSIVRYRDLGGNLMFLSSNNFFYRVERRGDRLYRTGRWIDLGRVDARLTGVHYLGWNHDRYPNRPYVVQGARSEPWFVKGTGLRNGDRFGSAYGVEIDAKSGDSPPGTVVLAAIPNVFGPGQTADMTYYQTRRGAKVFAAGAENFDSPQSPVTARLLENVWKHLRTP